MLKHLLLFGVLSAAGNVHAAGITHIASPPGGDVGNFVFDASHPGVALAGSSRGLIYRSSNGGSSWTPIKVGGATEEFRAIAQSPAVPNTFYAFSTGNSAAQTGPIGTGKVYSSQDDGESWALLPHQPPVAQNTNRGYGRGIVIDPTGQIVVLSDLFGGLFRSTNAGQSWTVVQPVTTHPHGLTSDPGHPGTLYAAGSHTSQAGVRRAAILKSTDFGASWSITTPPVMTIKGSKYPEALGISVQPGSGTVYATFDGVNPSTYLSTGGIARSTDGGVSWSADPAGLPADFEPGNSAASIVFDPTTPSTIYLTSNGGALYRSIDNGDHWSLTPAAVPYGAAFTAVARPAEAGYPAAVFVGYPDIATTTNGGQSWTVSMTGFNNSYIQTMADSGKMNGYFAGTASGVYRSLNGGASWIPAAALPGIDSAAVLAVDSSRPALPVYAIAPAGLFRSTNSGDSWVSITPHLGAGLVIQSVFTTPAGLLFATDNVRTIYRSANQGLTWTASPIGTSNDSFLSNPAIASANAPAGNSDTGLLYANLVSGLYVSHDNATSWELNPVQMSVNSQGYTPLIFSLAIQHLSPYTLYMSGSDRAGYGYTPGQSAFVSLPGLPAGGVNGSFQTAPSGTQAFDVESTSQILGSTDGFQTSANVAASLAPYNSNLFFAATALAKSLAVSDGGGSSFLVPYSNSQ